MQKAMFEKLTRMFQTVVPFVQFLGMKFISVESGLVLIEVPFRRELIGNPEVPALHGGVVSALLDTCGGAAVWSQLSKADRVSTVDLRIDYLRPARPEKLIGSGRVIRLGNRVGVTELRAYHPGAEAEPVAVGTGVYNVHRASAAAAGAIWDLTNGKSEEPG